LEFNKKSGKVLSGRWYRIIPTSVALISFSALTGYVVAQLLAEREAAASEATAKEARDQGISGGNSVACRFYREIFDHGIVRYPWDKPCDDYRRRFQANALFIDSARIFI
jgi:hypothetical protein